MILSTLRAHTFVVVHIAALLTTACERPSAVHFTVAPGATATNLLFLREAGGEQPMIRGVAIRSADGRYPGSTGPLFWSMAASSARELPAPDSLRYAVPPAGFTGGPPALLIPGEYQIEVQIGGHTTITYFKIATDGHASS